STPITVSETPSNHNIMVGPGPGDGNVLVSVDGVGQVFRRPGPVIIDASGGDHTITVEPALPRDVKVEVIGGVNTLGLNHISALTVSGGTVNFSSGQPVIIPMLILSGGLLTGSDTITVSGLTTWSAGTMSGTGSTVVQG